MGDNRESHEYPDPEDTPRFAWAGTKGLTTFLEKADDSENNSDAITFDDIVPLDDYQNGRPLFEPNQRRDFNDETIDPDFECQEDSDKYVQIPTLLPILSFEPTLH